MTCYRNEVAQSEILEEGSTQPRDCMLQCQNVVLAEYLPDAFCIIRDSSGKDIEGRIRMYWSFTT